MDILHICKKALCLVFVTCMSSAIVFSATVQDRYVIDFAARIIRSITPKFWSIGGDPVNQGEVSIGVYGDYYDFRAGVFFELPPDRLLAHAPANVRDAVAGRQVDARIVLWHAHQFSDPQLDLATVGRSHGCAHADNAVLHPLVRSWRSDDNYFNVNVQAGIFEPTDVLPQNLGENNTLGLNALRSINVNYHAGPAFSPNNARINYTNPDAGFATFWLVALSPSSNRAYVSLNVVATNQASVDRLKRLFPSNLFEQGQGPATLKNSDFDTLFGNSSPLRARLNILLPEVHSRAERLPVDIGNLDEDGRLDVYLNTSNNDIAQALNLAIHLEDTPVVNRLAAMITA